MSAVSTRKRINKADILKLRCVTDCKGYVENDVLTTNELLSPTKIRSEFIEGFNNCVNNLKADSTETLAAMKVAFETLAIGKYKSGNPELLSQDLSNVKSSGSVPEFLSGMKKVLPELEKAHVHLFHDVLIEACKDASLSCDFDTVIVSSIDDTTRIIAQNKDQQLLISEVSMDPADKEFSIKTVPFGFQGNGCEKALDRFDHALSSYCISSCKTRDVKQPSHSSNNVGTTLRNGLKRKTKKSLYNKQS